MKYIFALLAFLFCSSVFAQTDSSSYAILKVYRGAGSRGDSVKVKVYNQEPFHIDPNTVVTYKIYSTGGFVVAASIKRGSGIGGWNFNAYDNKYFMQFVPGETHYMVAIHTDNDPILTEVKKKNFYSRYNSSNVNFVELEEDMEKPIKRKD